MLRAELDGFKAEKRKPTKSNAKALGKLITLTGEEFECVDPKNWNDLLEYSYNKLAFFRKYYCGQDIPDFLYTGGLHGREVRKGEKLNELTQWQRHAKDLTQWANDEAERQHRWVAERAARSKGA